MIFIKRDKIDTLRQTDVQKDRQIEEHEETDRRTGRWTDRREKQT